MEGHRLPATKSVGFCLLSSELIEYVFTRLASPDICRLRCVSKPIASILGEQGFVRNYNDQHRSSTWLFFYNKPANQDHAALYGFTGCSNRWFKILVHDLLKSVVHYSGEYLYFLTASGSNFLFALNARKEFILVNPTTTRTMSLSLIKMDPHWMHHYSWTPKIGLSSEMEGRRLPATNCVGFCLLPSELMEYIFIRLASPDICQLRCVSKPIASILREREFVLNHNDQHRSSTWLFFYNKPADREDAALHGFSDRSNRWFKILVHDLLKSVVPSGEYLYFLTASGSNFLFALNTRKEVVLVNPMTRTVRKIICPPQGPHGIFFGPDTSIKLLFGPPGADQFCVLFAQFINGCTILFEYNSNTNKWRTITLERRVRDLSLVGDYVFLSVFDRFRRCANIICVSQRGHPEAVSIWPTLACADSSWEIRGDGLHSYRVIGDGKMVIVRSDGVDDKNKRIRMLKGVELWGITANGKHWEFISETSREIVAEMKKPYGVIEGCLEERNGTIRVALMFNFQGVWDIIWLSYDLGRRNWTRVVLPDCQMKGSSMVGISFSSGLILS
ncbi:hypothetical protein RJ640_029657 [Escallonia rubra]|uniref:F-box domain-containing protein n=1 Tax=Escallonia rubra TaxID=112253 RepID=A0AA88QN05_9ASTE|nr:hypothetical protein RJ640_029657 [Escallonia rubra]